MNNCESIETLRAGYSKFHKPWELESGVFHESQRYQLAIFDFDGTLADSFAWFLGVINEVADTYRFRKIEEEDLQKLRDCDARRMLAHVGVPMWKMPTLQRHLRKRMTNDIGKIALFPGVGGLLKGLRENGIALAIVTSNSLLNVRQVLGPQNTGLIQYFECGVPVLGKRAKLRRVLHSSGVQASEALFIGDEIRDLQAAHAEGIDFGAVSWGVNSIDSLNRNLPEEIFSSVDEIAALFRKTAYTPLS